MTAQDRLHLLRRAISEQPSVRWTTGMVQRLYRQHGLDVPHRATAKGDLALLARQRLLTVCGPENGRYYLFNPFGTPAGGVS